VNLHSRIQSSTAAFSTPFNTGIQCAHRINAPHEVTRSDNDYESMANRGANHRSRPTNSHVLNPPVGRSLGTADARFGDVGRRPKSIRSTGDRTNNCGSGEARSRPPRTAKACASSTRFLPGAHDSPLQYRDNSDNSSVSMSEHWLRGKFVLRVVRSVRSG
jgi:hypothetical protein